MANGKRNRKYIKVLESKEITLLDNINILEEILHFFWKLYTSVPRESWRLEGLDWSLISIESVTWLDCPFLEEEILKTIFQLDKYKAFGLDGFTIAMFQECWDVIKGDLLRVF